MVAGERETDVLIVGTSTGGLLLSLDLLRKNVKHLIISSCEEKLEEEKTNEQYLLYPRTLEMLQDLNILSEVLINSLKLTGISLYIENKLVHKTSKSFFQNFNVTIPYMLSINKIVLNNILRKYIKQFHFLVEDYTILRGINKNCNNRENKKLFNDTKEYGYKNRNNIIIKPQKMNKEISSKYGEKRISRKTNSNEPYKNKKEKRRNVRKLYTLPSLLKSRQSENTGISRRRPCNSKCSSRTHSSTQSSTQSSIRSSIRSNTRGKDKMSNNLRKKEYLLNHNKKENNKNGSFCTSFTYKTESSSNMSTSSATSYSTNTISSLSNETEPISFYPSCFINSGSSTNYKNSLNDYKHRISDSSFPTTSQGVTTKIKLPLLTNLNGGNHIRHKDEDIINDPINKSCEYSLRNGNKGDNEEFLVIQENSSINISKGKRRNLNLMTAYVRQNNFPYSRGGTKRIGSNRRRDSPSRRESLNRRDRLDGSNHVSSTNYYYHRGRNKKDVRHYSEIKSKYIVGVDGRKSSVRKFAHIKLEDKKNEKIEYISVDICAKWNNDMSHYNLSIIQSKYGFVTCFPIFVDITNINEKNFYCKDKQIKKIIKKIKMECNLRKKEKYINLLKKKNKLKIAQTSQFFSLSNTDKDNSNVSLRNETASQNADHRYNEGEKYAHLCNSKQINIFHKNYINHNIQKGNKRIHMDNISVDNINEVDHHDNSKNYVNDISSQKKEQKNIIYQEILDYYSKNRNSSTSSGEHKRREKKNLQISTYATSSLLFLKKEVPANIDNPHSYKNDVVTPNTCTYDIADTTMPFEKKNYAFEEIPKYEKHMKNSIKLRSSSEGNYPDVFDTKVKGRIFLFQKMDHVGREASLKESVSLLGTVAGASSEQPLDKCSCRGEPQGFVAARSIGGVGNTIYKFNNNVGNSSHSCIPYSKEAFTNGGIDGDDNPNANEIILLNNNMNEECNDYNNDIFSMKEENIDMQRKGNKNRRFPTNNSFNTDKETPLKVTNSRYNIGNIDGYRIVRKENGHDGTDNSFTDAVSNNSREGIDHGSMFFMGKGSYNWHLTICRRGGGKTLNKCLYHIKRSKKVTYEEVIDIIKNVFPSIELYYLYNLKVGRHKDKICKNYYRNSIILAGESNCFYNPLFNISINLTIHDVYNIGWKLNYLINHNSSSLLLESYDKERKFISEKVLSWNSKIFNFFFFIFNCNGNTTCNCNCNCNYNYIYYILSFLNCCTCPFANFSSIHNFFEKFYLKTFMLQNNYYGQIVANSSVKMCSTSFICSDRAKNCILKYIYSNNNYEEKSVCLYDYLRDQVHTLILCINISEVRSTPYVNFKSFKKRNRKYGREYYLGNYKGYEWTYDKASLDKLIKIRSLTYRTMMKTPNKYSVQIIWVLCNNSKNEFIQSNTKLFPLKSSSSFTRLNINFYNVPNQLLNNIKAPRIKRQHILYDFLNDFQKQFNIKLNLPNNLIESHNFKSAMYIFIRPDLHITHMNYVNDDKQIVSFLDFLYKFYG
ncbi:conserved Plasmodium protein, unknown function [Plasmodium malariae]|nr:conserved Plasmodium protein, unknown function [Plasmodium malariae]SBT87515.1 conserved Plasmodium protein, unknown function [Plasmodium malariae]